MEAPDPADSPPTTMPDGAAETTWPSDNVAAAPPGETVCPSMMMPPPEPATGAAV